MGLTKEGLVFDLAEAPTGRFLDTSYEQWSAIWTEHSDWAIGGRYLKSYDRQAQDRIVHHGLARAFFTYSHVLPVVARNFNYQELAARANVLEQLYRDGNDWESIPLSVRTSRVVQGSAFWFFERLMREWSFVEMLEAGLKLCDAFPADWDGISVCPRLYPVGGVPAFGEHLAGFDPPTIWRARSVRLHQPGDPEVAYPPAANVLAAFAADTGVRRRG